MQLLLEDTETAQGSQINDVVSKQGKTFFHQSMSSQDTTSTIQIFIFFTWMIAGSLCTGVAV
jgi:hypothetical protein